MRATEIIKMIEKIQDEIPFLLEGYNEDELEHIPAIKISPPAYYRYEIERCFGWHMMADDDKFSLLKELEAFYTNNNNIKIVENLCVEIGCMITNMLNIVYVERLLNPTENTIIEYRRNSTEHIILSLAADFNTFIKIYTSLRSFIERSDHYLPNYEANIDNTQKQLIPFPQNDSTKNEFDKLVARKYIIGDYADYAALRNNTEPANKLMWDKRSPKQPKTPSKSALIEMLGFISKYTFDSGCDIQTNDRSHISELARKYFNITLSSSNFNKSQTTHFNDLKAIIK